MDGEDVKPLWEAKGKSPDPAKVKAAYNTRLEKWKLADQSRVASPILLSAPKRGPRRLIGLRGLAGFARPEDLLSPPSFVAS